MKVVIIYESMYGNTHHVAEKIAEVALESADLVELIAVSHAVPDSIDGADLVVVGGPTHIHSLTSAATRRDAIDHADKYGSPSIDPDAEGPGLRDYFDSLGRVAGTKAAAFDTRFDAAAILTGRASKGISQRLRKHGFNEVVPAESFIVDKENHLLDGQDEHAVRWTRSVMEAASS